MTMSESSEEVESVRDGDENAPPDDENDENDEKDERDEKTNGDRDARASGSRRPRKRRPKSRPRGEEYAPQDERSRQALDFVTDLIRKMQMDCDVRLVRPRDPDDSEICIEISGDDAGRVIGKKGQVLTAVQFLTNRIVNRPGLEKRHILVDAEGYRRRREDSLATMARRLGKQAVSDGKIITFEPMNPRDRRVVHLALAKFEGVVTKSEGEGDDRRVQIIPVRR